ncbi:MAG: helix-turn-helix domain-containing protein [Planctomycetota bacterium]
MSRSPWTVAIVIAEDAHAFEYACVAEVFGLPRPELSPWYAVRTCGPRTGEFGTRVHLRLVATHTYAGLDRAGTIVVPGWRPDIEVPRQLRRKLRRAQDEGARLVSVCTGAFVLAAAGVVGDRTITTHWRWADTLASMYPGLRVDPDVLYTDESGVVTSAGSAAGLDACLHLVRKDCGAEVANRVARSLVVAPHREGGQRQFVETPMNRRADDDGIAELLADIHADPRQQLTVAQMARRAHMSERTFARRFKAATGTTPNRWVLRERVRLAQRLLETPGLAVDTVAARSGFSDPQVLRLHFKREVGTSPTAYRRTFHGQQDAG